MNYVEQPNLQAFIKRFPNDAACRAYIATIKWRDGFKCRRCGHNEAEVRENSMYKCTRCYYPESATVGTMFNRVKFGLHKAFCITYDMMVNEADISAKQMSAKYGMTLNTCYMFIYKVNRAIKFNDTYGFKELDLTP